MAVEAPILYMGAQWGDEGKGKLVDVAAQKADVVIKSNGGENAGHTVENEHGEFKSHLMPGGFANPNALNVIGAHVVVEPLQLLKEVDDIENRLPFPTNLLIAGNAPLVMPWHKVRDDVRETSKGENSLGTTRKGIGDTYSDFALREGFLVRDLVKPDFRDKYMRAYEEQDKIIRRLGGEALVGDLEFENTPEGIKALEKIIFDAKQHHYMDPDKSLEQYEEAGERLRPMIGDVEVRLREAYEAGKVIIGEAGQAALLSPTSGYPFVTSSNPGVAGFLISTGFKANEMGPVIGTTKAYMTRVGSGPMPTELHDETGEYLRKRGREYGATTGRPRRTGWFDGPATRYAVRTSGITELALTKSDILDELPEIGLCVGYEVDGVQHDRVGNFDPDFIGKAKPIIEMVKGWQSDTTGIRAYQDFPDEAKAYFDRIQELAGAPINTFSVGPNRDAIVYR